MTEVAIVTTGGYYYNWQGGSAFYDWLNNFCANNSKYTPHVISWRPENSVPEKVKSDFKNIHYRPNNGCDWGCYNYFVESIKKNDIENQYRYAIFCHDDILSAEYNWPTYLFDFMEKNKNILLSSFAGSYHEIDVSKTSTKLNPGGFVKGFTSMCFIVRLTKNFLENNPFVTIPGFDQDLVGDSGCAVVQHNIWNTFGSEKIASVFHSSKNRNVLDFVRCFKRGRSVRVFTEENISNEHKLAPVLNYNQVINQGWTLKPGQFAENSSLGINKDFSGEI